MPDAEIKEQTARMVGHYVHGVRAGVVLVDICVGGEPTGERDAWDPIHSGDDFDAVLMCARRDCGAVGEVLAQKFASGFLVVATDAEFRRAVCLAIVEAVK